MEKKIPTKRQKILSKDPKESLKNFGKSCFYLLTKVIGFIFKIIFCLILSLVIWVGVAIIFLNFELNWQVILYLLTAGIVFVGLLFIVFAKTSKKAKFIYVILFMIFMLMPKMLPYIKHVIEVDACIDSGICSEKRYK